MSSRAQRTRLPEIRRVFKAVRRANNADPKDIRVKVDTDGSYTVFYMPPSPQAPEQPLDDGGEIVL